jgi:hypothetical protein
MKESRGETVWKEGIGAGGGGRKEEKVGVGGGGKWERVTRVIECANE